MAGLMMGIIRCESGKERNLKDWIINYLMFLIKKDDTYRDGLGWLLVEEGFTKMAIGSEDIERVRNEYLINIIGDYNTCVAKRVKVDAPWHCNWKATYGWVCLEKEGNIILKGQIVTRTETPSLALTMAIREALLYVGKEEFNPPYLSSI